MFKALREHARCQPRIHTTQMCTCTWTCTCALASIRPCMWYVVCVYVSALPASASHVYTFLRTPISGRTPRSAGGKEGIASERSWQTCLRQRASLTSVDIYTHICIYIHVYIYIYIYGFRSSMYITGTEIRIQHILLRFKLLVSRAHILGPGEACHPSHFLSVDNLLCKK